MKDQIVFWTHAYNSEKTVERTIQSILSQTYEDFEYVILDNGSNDRTRDIIKKYAKQDSRIKPIYSDKNILCMSHAYLPLLLEEAKGGYLAWLDADDEYDKTFLEKMYYFVKSNNLLAACCGTVYDRPNEPLKPDKPQKTMVLQGKEFADNIPLYYKNVIRLWCNLFSTKLLTTDLFPSKSYSGSTFFDSMIPLNIYRRADRAGALSECLHKYYIRSGQLSTQYTPKFYWWICKITDHLRDYLKSYGPLTQSSEDFIWQRFFVWLLTAINMLKSSEVNDQTKINDIVAMLKGERTKQLFQKDWKAIGIITTKKDFLKGLADYSERMSNTQDCILASAKLISTIKTYSEEV